MDLEENDIEQFMLNNRGTHANRQINTTSSKRAQSLITNLKFISLKIPSVILCEYVLTNSDYIYDEISLRFNKILLSSYLVYFIYKFFLLLAVLVCILLFALSNKYVYRLYESILLVLQPFMFTYMIEAAHKYTIILADYVVVPHLLITGIIHLFIGLNTIFIYSDLYTNVISDKFNIYQDYLANREQNRDQNAEPTIEDYIHNLYHRRDESANRASNDEQNDENSIIAKLSKKKRIIFIATYSLLSYYVNEIRSNVNKDITFEFIQGSDLLKIIGTNNSTLEYFNIISLGYLCLLTYDLSFNLDQLLLRFVIKLRELGNAITQYGINNLLGFNWFVRLKVPFIMRVYFGIKLTYYTINFLAYFDYYFNLNSKLENQTYTESYSLFNTIYSFFMPDQPSVLSSSSKNIENNNLEPVLNSTLAISHTQPIQNYVVFNSIWSLFNSQNETFNSMIYGISLSNVLAIYFKMLVLNFSETIVSIGATTSILSYQFYLIGVFLAKIISSSPNSPTVRPRPVDNNNNRVVNNNNDLNNDFTNVGDVAAILFFLLSIQSGLSSLDGNQRIEKFLKNYSLLFIAILHYFHTTLDAQLMNLSASSKLKWSNEKHVRLLGVCLSLIVIPFIILCLLWYNFKISTWLLAASAFNIELIVKMSVSLLIYAIFIFDSIRASKAYEKLSKKQEMTDSEMNNRINELSDNTDDYIYCIRAFGHIVEFMVALFLFFNGAYILFFESYGAVRAIMMCIHAYFHIFCQARKGWSVFIKRRTAISKMKRLAVLTLESYRQLVIKKKHSQNVKNYFDFDAIDESRLVEEFRETCGEPCAICFCEISAHEARITNCNHIFHFVCLRKWIYFQDTCPMCHQIVYQTPSSVTPTSSS